jgi:CubicO group peptidase (beta-lactamase class C family)
MHPFVLPPTEPSAAGLDPHALEGLCRLIEGHIADGRYPGAQVAIARHGKLAFSRTFGAARIEPELVPARDNTLWLLYSNTKVVTAAAVWALAQDGALSFNDRVSDHVPEFVRHGKEEVTVLQLLTHQGGFPSAGQSMPHEAFDDHQLLRRLVCDFTLEWAPGTRVHYHPAAAHWVAAVLIEAIAKTDYRTFIGRRIIEPLGLGHELYVGVPDAEMSRAADMHEPSPDGTRQVKRENECGAVFRRAGIPGGGGFATARAMAAFYQMMAQGGTLNGIRLFSPRMIQFVTRNFTGERIDGSFAMAMHRGLGPHSRGTTEKIRGLGAIGSPQTFGHGGVGSSYSWADPTTGVSFCYISNSRIPDPWHSRRLEIVSDCVHGAIEDAE